MSFFAIFNILHKKNKYQLLQYIKNKPSTKSENMWITFGFNYINYSVFIIFV
ncbi:hypothetical protein CRENPOLYSF2_860007 [Crenothrix polyspora]|uniref:Uncharacterized protein n=1 Tax=Crenothrix polyspora TaxID=360316 RepID=A0A1R4HIN4_9GAMM|nr:hypothetical protein CRENPOLYSF2_860007 [Crenothrix polyspora]